MGDPVSEHAVALGHRIRSVRRARALTLVELAARAQLSHPFLSQLERGLAQPSMTSLSKIARALGSSQLELLAGAGAGTAEYPRAPAGSPVLVRAAEADRGPYGLGEATLLANGDAPFLPMLFSGDNAEPGEYHRHAEGEFLHVLQGRAVVDLGECVELATGDSLYYEGGTAHRWFSPTGSPYRLFVVKQHPAEQPPTDGS